MTQMRTPRRPDAIDGALDLDRDFWREHSQITLQPVAAPSILGLYGFAGATFMVATNLAGWWGDQSSALYLFPFAALFGGMAQFLAGMWAYRARDGLATAMHGTWGAFWLGYGLLFLLVATGALTLPTGAFVALGYWFIVLAAVTWAGAAAAVYASIALTAVLTLLAAGSTFAAIGYGLGASWALTTAGWLFICSAVVAWYVATAMVFESVRGTSVLPVGKREAVDAPASGLIEFHPGEPGIRHGQ
ncbi:MAG TPA: GPR1/FUN34/YaaH family transporter [Geodermatophilus sp.]|nr:GPR1/FUN34/YaaH family transporter [Geodermatophilus sp.]